MQTKTIKTVLHTYNFDTSEPDQAAQYKKLAAELRATPGRGEWMNSWGERKPDYEAALESLNGKEIELETDFLFENQWNTSGASGNLRVFDWYEEYPAMIPPRIKRGHYLDITEEMIQIRRQTLVDGWAGNFFPASSGLNFNTLPSAIGSPYLKETELHLLRLLPVAERHGKRAELTAEEKAFLLPLYVAAQTKNHDEAKAAKLAEVRADLAQKLKLANMEHDGFTWLLDHDVSVENCIFYSHTAQFCFGWRNAYTGEARLALLEALKAFPFPYDVK